jgi:hypothetical protein
VGGGYGQTAKRQLDGLADLGVALSAPLHWPVEGLWRMQNGYALCPQVGLDAITEHLRALNAQQLDDLRSKLRIGLHRDVEVTEAFGENRPVVSQAFCSALPVAYTSIVPSHWKAFACLVLEGAYEATMWAAVQNAQRGASNVVLLTSLGGGAFGNDETWIIGAMRRTLGMMRETALDTKLVSYGAPSRALLHVAEELS